MRVFVAGHRGLVGSAIAQRLEHSEAVELVTCSKDELNLSDHTEVRNFFKANRLDQVYLAAGKVGGIYANNVYPAEFIYQNLMIEANVIHEAYEAGIEKLLFLGSSCIYPKFAEQPIRELELFSGPLEPTNEPYAIAKIAGIKLCESYNRQYGVDYRSVMPTNLYGPGDNYSIKNSHVLPSLLRRIHEAKEQRIFTVEVWGSGRPLREFLYVEDLADACITVMNTKKNIFDELANPMCSHINVGSGHEISVYELAQNIKRVVGYKGEILFDPTRPDGTPRKLLDSSLIKSLGWSPKYSFEVGLEKTYNHFLSNDYRR